VADALARARALDEARALDQEGHLTAIAAASKRIGNLLRQARERQEPYGTEVATEALAEPEERALSQQLSAATPEIDALRRERRYREALARVASLRPAVDGFFDRVMVMAPDAALRRNRLALIAQAGALFSAIADFSEIAPA
jgi:glycyl-tRNA synthetase beta chain